MFRWSVGRLVVWSVGKWSVVGWSWSVDLIKTFPIFSLAHHSLSARVKAKSVCYHDHINLTLR